MPLISLSLQVCVSAALVRHFSEDQVNKPLDKFIGLDTDRLRTNCHHQQGQGQRAQKHIAEPMQAKRQAQA
jgi:hypothetical protein